MRPLEGLTILDTSRMLPGAVLARLALEAGARLVKVEAPHQPDLMRHTRPLLPGGTAAGYAAFRGGEERLALDLRTPEGAAALLERARRADALVESFRPGTLASWGLGPERLMAENPRLVVVSLSAYGQADPGVGHDLNLMAEAGALDTLGLPGGGVPGVQLADVGCGMLAYGALASALLAVQRGGRGTWIDQPMSSGLAPFLAWRDADARAGGRSDREAWLTGHVPAYARYRTADGGEVAVGALEPKLLGGLLEALGLPPALAAGALAPRTEPEGLALFAALEEAFGALPAHEWERLTATGLPVTVVAAPTAPGSRHRPYAEGARPWLGLADARVPGAAP